MLRPSPQHGHLADEEIIDDLTAVLVGAIEPATRAAGWILLTLARHPQAADQVAAEARTLPDDRIW